MTKRETKIQDRYVDRGFGFPIVLKGVTMAKVNNRWTPLVNYNVLSTAVLAQLASLDGRLTGNQVRFIRLTQKMTLQQFAGRLGLTHPAVLKWERTGDNPTGMNWSTEKDIRLLAASALNGIAKDFLRLYHKLEKAVPANAARVELDAVLLAA